MSSHRLLLRRRRLLSRPISTAFGAAGYPPPRPDQLCPSPALTSLRTGRATRRASRTKQTQGRVRPNRRGGRETDPSRRPLGWPALRRDQTDRARISSASTTQTSRWRRTRHYRPRSGRKRSLRVRSPTRLCTPNWAMTRFPTTSKPDWIFSCAVLTRESRARKCVSIVSCGGPHTYERIDLRLLPSFADASPTNHFWKCLAGSGLTDRLLHPSEGPLLPSIGIGSTNLVQRPSAEVSFSPFCHQLRCSRD